MIESDALLVRDVAFVEVVADDRDDEGVGRVGVARVPDPGQILAERRARHGEAVDPARARQVRGQAPLDGLRIGHHLRLYVGVPDDDNQRSRAVPVIILLVEETVVVDPTRIRVLEVPTHGMREARIGGSAQDRVRGIERQGSHAHLHR